MGLLDRLRPDRGTGRDGAPGHPARRIPTADGEPPGPSDVIRQSTLHPAPPDWAGLPPLQRTLADMPVVVSTHFEDSLVARRVPQRFLGDLGHSVSDAAPSGIIEGVALLAPMPTRQALETGAATSADGATVPSRAAPPLTLATPHPPGAGARDRGRWETARRLPGTGRPSETEWPTAPAVADEETWPVRAESPPVAEPDPAPDGADHATLEATHAPGTREPDLYVAGAREAGPRSDAAGAVEADAAISPADAGPTADLIGSSSIAAVVQPLSVPVGPALNSLVQAPTPPDMPLVQLPTSRLPATTPIADDDDVAAALPRRLGDATGEPSPPASAPSAAALVGERPILEPGAPPSAAPRAGDLGPGGGAVPAVVPVAVPVVPAPPAAAPPVPARLEMPLASPPTPTPTPAGTPARAPDMSDLLSGATRVDDSETGTGSGPAVSYAGTDAAPSTETVPPTGPEAGQSIPADGPRPPDARLPDAPLPADAPPSTDAVSGSAPLLGHGPPMATGLPLTARSPAEATSPTDSPTPDHPLAGAASQPRAGLGAPMSSLPATAAPMDITRMSRAQQLQMSRALIQSRLATRSGPGLPGGDGSPPARDAGWAGANATGPVTAGMPLARAPIENLGSASTGVVPDDVAPAGPATAPLVSSDPLLRPDGPGPSSSPPAADGAAVRAAVGGRHGVDLARVPVDRSERGAAEAHRAGARAFTSDLAVVIPQSAGSLDSGPGQALLAHELTHVAQRVRYGGSAPEESSPAGRALEAEAASVEMTLSSGGFLRPSTLEPPAGTASPAGGPGQAGTPLPLAAPAPTGPDYDVLADSILQRMTTLTSPAQPVTQVFTAASLAAPAAAAMAPAGMQRAPLDVQTAVPVLATTPPAPAESTDPMPRPSDEELSNLSRWLYPLIKYRLKGDLREDRERAGLLTDHYRRW